MITSNNLFTNYQIRKLTESGKKNFTGDSEQSIKEIKNWISGLSALSKKLKKEQRIETPFVKKILCDVLGHKLIGEEKIATILNQDSTGAAIPDIKIGLFNTSVVDDLNKIEPSYLLELKGPSCTNFRKSQKSRKDKKSPVQQLLSDMFGEGESCKFGIVTNYIEYELFSREFGNKRSLTFNLNELKTAEDFYFLYAILGRKSDLIDHKKIVGEFKKIETKKTGVSKDFYLTFRTVRNNILDKVEKKLGDDNANEFTTKLLSQALFTIYAESIGLLPHGGLLKVLKLSNYDWKAYRRFVRIIDKGGKLKGEGDIFGYNGGLFRDCDLFKKNYDKAILKQLNYLLHFRFQYESGKEMDSFDLRDVLGRMLEHTLEVNKEEKLYNFTKEGKFADARKKQSQKNDRQKKGVFYTPGAVTNYMVERVIKELTANGKNISKSSWMDLACGSGAFLTETFHQLVEYEKQKLGFKESQKYNNPKLLKLESFIQGEVLKRVHGIDIDKLAIGVGQLSLSLTCVEPERKLPTLTQTIVEGDSLFDYDGKQYDVIISNPPYMQWRYIPESYRDWLSEDDDYKTLAQDSSDYSSFFFRSALDRLKPGGILAFISTNKSLAISQGEGFRKWLLEEFDIVELLDFRKKVFKGTEIEPCIYILKKKKTKAAAKKYIDVNKFLMNENHIEVQSTNKVPVSLFKKSPYFNIPTRTSKSLIDVFNWYYKNKSKFKKLGELAKIKAGMRITDIPSKEVLTIKPKGPLAKKYEPLLDGPALVIGRKTHSDINRWVKKDSKKVANWKTDLHTVRNECVLIKELCTRPAIIKFNKIPAAVNSIGLAVPYDICKLSTKELADWLLNPFVEAYMELWFGANRTHANQRWKNTYIECLPVPKDKATLNSIPDDIVKSAYYFVEKYEILEDSEAA